MVKPAVPAVYVIVTVKKNKTAYGPYKGGPYKGEMDAINHLREHGWGVPIARSDITRFAVWNEKDREYRLADFHFGFVTKIKVKPRSRLPDMRKKQKKQ